jgi:hypothetical protein
MNKITFVELILFAFFNYGYGVSYNLADITITFTNRGTYTDFELTYFIGGSTNNWIAVGFNVQPLMVIFDSIDDT